MDTNLLSFDRFVRETLGWKWGSGMMEYASGQSWTESMLRMIPLLVPLFTFVFFFAWRSALFKTFAPPGLGVWRLWVAFSAAYTVSSVWQSATPRGTFHRLVSYLTGINWLPNSRTAAADTAEEDDQTQQKALEPFTGEELADFKERIRSADAAVEANTGQWVKMCEQRTPEIDYVAHRNILKDGSTVYYSKTVCEDADAELMSTFYNSDESRVKWDMLLASASPVDVDSASTTEAVYWVRKFPVACGPRDYVFGRRSWTEDLDQFYTVTKSITHPKKPLTNQPKRVERYYSSWLIRPVKGRNSESKTAVETILVHYECMGIPNAVARFAVRQGMWTVVKNMCNGYKVFVKDTVVDPTLLRPSFELSAEKLAPKLSPQLSVAPTDGPSKAKKLRVVVCKIAGLLLLGMIANSKLGYRGRRQERKRQKVAKDRTRREVQAIS